jgi:hypothetical protein
MVTRNITAHQAEPRNPTAYERLVGHLLRYGLSSRSHVVAIYLLLRLTTMDRAVLVWSSAVTGFRLLSWYREPDILTMGTPIPN